MSPLKESRLGKAVTYALNQKPYMENYLLDGRCSISNNIAENSIRPFTLGRKSWLFSDTPKEADASAIVYSIVETAMVNNLNVFTYLNYLLLYMPDMDYRNYPEVMDDMMPWSKRVQQECKTYPYLLRGRVIDRPNQVWSIDITYIPMKSGFMYLFAIIDWHSRYIVGWKLSNFLRDTMPDESIQQGKARYYKQRPGLPVYQQ